jgi:tetratricopeptide (TPR) repeat protein
VNELRNPYIAGAPVVETSMFFGREDVFSWIERCLEGKYIDHILVLHGQRRVGKTSVLKQIPNFLPKKYIQVFFDLQGRTGTTLDRFLWWLASEIVRTLKKERDISISRPARNAFQDTEILISEFLPGLRSLLGDQVLLLTFDEFDTLDQPEIQETLTKPLIVYLRRLMELDGLSFIFSIGSSGNKLENMQASYTEFFKSALYRKISFLTKDDCYRLITKPVEGVLTYDDKAIDLIYEITSGHPYFTQLMCHELFSLCQKTGTRSINQVDVDSVLDDVIERGTVNLKFIWDEATDLEKWILASLAQLESGGTTRQLNELLQGQQIRFSEPDIYSAIIRLRDKDVLSRDNQFIVHLLLLWLQRNRPLDRVREELVEINTIVNRYIEIAEEYREKGQFEKALENFRNALEEDPKSVNAQTSIAMLLLERCDFEKAIESFQAALVIDHENIASLTGLCDAFLGWGDQQSSEGETEDAITHYQKVLEINPDHIEARERLANLYWTKAEENLAVGQEEAALIEFKTASAFTPEDPELANRVQEIMVEKGKGVIASLAAKAESAQASRDWESAVAALEDALLLAEDDNGLQEKLAQVKMDQRANQLVTLPVQARNHEKSENWEEAAKVWTLYLSLSPPDLNEAQAALEHARKMQSIQTRYFQASKALHGKDYSRAIDLLREIIQVDPTYKDVTQLLTNAVRSSRRGKLNWRKIAWVAIPILLVAIVTGTTFIIQDRGGLAAIASWLASATPTPTATPTVTADLATPELTPSPTASLTPLPERTADFTETATVVQKTATPTPTEEPLFSKPIVDYIESHPPTFEDDFSKADMVWGGTSEGLAIFNMVEDVDGGILVITDHANSPGGWGLPGPGVHFPINGLFDATEFAFQFDFLNINLNEIGVKFLSTDQQSTNYKISFTKGGSWSLTQNNGANVISSGRTSLMPAYNTFLLIVYNQNLAVYLNGSLLYKTRDVYLEGDGNLMTVAGEHGKEGKFDNVKFWNLEGLEF